jgi:hypothetical protein
MPRHWDDLLVETIMRKRDVGLVALSIAPRRHGRDDTLPAGMDVLYCAQPRYDTSP